MSTSAHGSLVPDHDPRARRESCESGRQSMKPVTRAAGSFHAVTALLLVLALHMPLARAADQGQRVVYEGTVAVAVEDDFAHGRSTRRYFLDEQNLGQRFELKVNESQGKSAQDRRAASACAASRRAARSAPTPRLAGSPCLRSRWRQPRVAARKAVVVLVDIKDSSGTVAQRQRGLRRRHGQVRRHHVRHARRPARTSTAVTRTAPTARSALAAPRIPAARST